MPSSMIFTGLVVLWLIVLVPAVARHRQEVVRPSVVALSSRVLDRPQRRRSEEVDMPVDDPDLVEHAEADVPSYADDVDDTDDEREREPRRYRPGRGGFDAEAAALTARARYAFRQRVVLGLLVAAIASAVVALVAVPLAWWGHGAVDAALVGYLVYLRRQVRMEEQIRARRAARMTGARRRPAEDDDPEAVPDEDGPQVEGELDDVEEAAEPDELAKDTPERVRGTGEPVGLLRPVDGVVEEPALPRLQPAPPPPLPVGTTLVEADDEDVLLADIDLPHRRAVGE